MKIALTTISRPFGNYLFTTLASLFASDSSVYAHCPIDLFVGNGEVGYLDDLRHHDKIRIRQMSPGLCSRIASTAPHERLLANVIRIFEEAAGSNQGLLLCEDDVVFADGFIGRLFRCIQEIESGHAIARYALSLYSPHHAGNSDVDDFGLTFFHYGPSSFFGTQAMYYPAAVLPPLCDYLSREATGPDPLPVDLMIGRFAPRLDGFFACRQSLVQHIGRITTGLGYFHTSPTFDRQAPLPPIEDELALQSRGPLGAERRRTILPDLLRESFRLPDRRFLYAYRRVPVSEHRALA